MMYYNTMVMNKIDKLLEENYYAQQVASAMSAAANKRLLGPNEIPILLGGTLDTVVLNTISDPDDYDYVFTNIALLRSAEPEVAYRPPVNRFTPEMPPEDPRGLTLNI